MMSWKLVELDLPLNVRWKTARYSATSKKNFIVEIRNVSLFAQGEASLVLQNGESEELIRKSFDYFMEQVPASLTTLEGLLEFMGPLELPSSLRFAIESAFVHYLAALSGRSVHELLGINMVNSVKTSFSIPIMPVGQIKNVIEQNNLHRFLCLKIKVAEVEHAIETVREVTKNYRGNIRIDANEAWTNPDEVIRFIDDLGVNCPIEFLEQPLKVDCHDEYLYLKKHISVNVMADESVNINDITRYHQERFHGVNIKLMKAGGYMKALMQLRAARELRLLTMLGCMIETSLGISSALNIAYGVDYFDLDGFLLIENEPYKLITEENGRLFYSHLQ